MDNTARWRSTPCKNGRSPDSSCRLFGREWCAPVVGPESAFRNKAKMVVSGSVEKPLLGMLHRDGTPEDLCDCPLYPASFAPVFSALKPFIARAGLTPYNVARKQGELKYVRC